MPTSYPWLTPTAAYVHLPFCAHHCGYCDFAVAVGMNDRRGDYLRALAAELTRLGSPQPVDTLFFGGGTPTYLTTQELQTCLGDVLRWLPFKAGHEFSVEANPGTLDADKVKLLVEHGVTRVSLGCQSFDESTLRVLERDHRPADVGRSIDILRKYDIALSLDLIFGVPGQTPEMWDADLSQVLAFEPDGIATYGLTYEKGTRLWKQERAGQVQPVGEDCELVFYERAMDRLGEAGFVQYELSNFARPGRECRHNQAYWANDAHFGFGMGAAEYKDGERRLNTRDLAGYVRKALAGESTAFQTERLPPRERALETIGQNLRRIRGIERFDFRKRTGFDLDGLVQEALANMSSLALIEDDGERVRLSRRGKCVADSVIAEFWKARDEG
jgi:oxygen-independent coproporphyrinogen III oxidase